MKLFRVSDLYSKEELEKELENHIKRLRLEYPSQDAQRKKRMLQTSKLNIKFDGVQDWTKLSEKEKLEKITMGPIYHDAQCSLSKRRDFVRGNDKIVVFTTPISNAIAIGTTKSSITKFWTGIGILEYVKGEYKDKILSPSQVDSLDKFKTHEKSVNLIPLKNFKNIIVVEEKLEFSLNK